MSSLLMPETIKPIRLLRNDLISRTVDWTEFKVPNEFAPWASRFVILDWLVPWRMQRHTKGKHPHWQGGKCHGHFYGSGGDDHSLWVGRYDQLWSVERIQWEDDNDLVLTVRTETELLPCLLEEARQAKTMTLAFDPDPPDDPYGFGIA